MAPHVIVYESIPLLRQNIMAWWVFSALEEGMLLRFAVNDKSLIYHY